MRQNKASFFLVNKNNTCRNEPSNGDDKALLFSSPLVPAHNPLHHNKRDPVGDQEVSRVGSGNPIPARPARHHVVVQSRYEAFVKKLVECSTTACIVLDCKILLLRCEAPQHTGNFICNNWAEQSEKHCGFFFSIVEIVMRLTRTSPLGSIRPS